MKKFLPVIFKPLTCAMAALMLAGGLMFVSPQDADAQFNFYHRYKGFLYSPYGGAYTWLGPHKLKVSVPDVVQGDWYGVRFATDQTPGFEAIYEPFELQAGNKIDIRATGTFGGDDVEVATAQIEMLEDDEAQYTATFDAQMGVSEANMVLLDFDGNVLTDQIVPVGVPIRLHNYYWPFCSWRWRCDDYPAPGGPGKFWNTFRFYTRFNVWWNNFWYRGVWNFWYIARNAILPNYISYVDYRAYWNCAGWNFKCLQTQWYEGGPYAHGYGYAYLYPFRPYLTIGNLLGTTYWGGARIRLRQYGFPGVGFARVLFRGPAGAIPPGARQAFDAKGFVNNNTVEATDVMSLSSLGTGSGSELTADFTPIGSNTFHVQVYDGGVLTADVPGQTGMFAEVQEACEAIEFDREGDMFTPSIAMDFENVQSVTITGVGAFLGDRIVVHAEGPTSVINELEDVGVGGLGSPDIELAGVNTGALPTSVRDEEEGIIRNHDFTFYPNYPNPVSKTTTIKFDLNWASFVGVGIYDMRGKRVATLLDKAMNRGEHSVDWNATDDNGAQLPNGVYFARLEALPLRDEGNTTTVHDMQQIIVQR